MTDWTFTPTAEVNSLTIVKVPFYEDATADTAPNYTSRKTVAEAQSAVLHEMAKLGAGSVYFQEGYFGTEQPRHGYAVHFTLQGGPGVIRVAGMPIKHSATAKKVDAVRVQALLTVRDWLKASVTAQMFAPGNNVLYQHLLVDGTRTVADMFAAGNLPQLKSGA